MATVEAPSPTPTGDVDMEESRAAAGGEDVEEMLGGIEPEVVKRTTFLDYLKSPIVELAVGTGEEETLLWAHQAMLVKSPYFAEICGQFGAGATRRRIDLPNDDLSAAGSVLEYLYNGEYFPRRLSASKDAPLEPDPSLPSPDNTGAALLQHAKVYTLADKLGLPVLKSLAHAKIHRTSSTARGEIAYARYVYKETSKEDVTIRRPVAAFWATRSHVLRHEAEDEFRAMCLEFPQFGFDVLSLVLDQREKKGERGHAEPAVVPGSAHGRKRARVSQG